MNGLKVFPFPGKFILATLFLPCLACGGGIDSGVPDNKQGDELNGEEIQAVCEATVHYRDETIDPGEFSCRFAGSAAAIVSALSGDDLETVREACTEAYEPCKQEAIAEAPTAEERCANVPETAPECDATVAEVEACLTENVDRQKEAIEAIPTCSAINDENVEEEQDQEQETDSSDTCDAMLEKCPEAASLLLY